LISDKSSRGVGPDEVSEKTHAKPEASRQASPHATAPADGSEAALRLLALENELASIRTALLATNLYPGNDPAQKSDHADAAHGRSSVTRPALHTVTTPPAATNDKLAGATDLFRATVADLQDILANSGVATILLDLQDRIQFFTPATRSLFHILPGDIGRPLADLAPFAPDPDLAADLAAAREQGETRECDIESTAGVCYCRRVALCCSQHDRIIGVVITYTDITDRRQTARMLKEARDAAESASLAKSRFLSAASHDLRQPLQALVLLQELLAQKIADPDCRTLLGRVDRTLDSMAALLDSLLDINRIEAGAVDVTPGSFELDGLLAEIVEGLAGQAEASGLKLRWVRSGLTVVSDRRHLASMIQNLVANALKYTARGGVVVGGRRRGDQVHIEVWDSGIGIPADQIDVVFLPYEQLGAATNRKQGVGMGLGLAIVRSLGNRLGHEVTLRSRVGKGSVFSITVPPAPADTVPAGAAAPTVSPPALAPEPRVPGKTGARILVIDDDPDLLELLSRMLDDCGHTVIAARDEVEAMAAVLPAAPDLILSDFRLANGHDGLDLSQRLRARIREMNGRAVPVIILTGDISIETLVRFAANDVVRLSKPIRPTVLRVTIESLLGTPAIPVARGADDDAPDGIVHVIDDDPLLLNELGVLLNGANLSVCLHGSAEAFRSEFDYERAGCLLIDVRLPGESGMDLMKSLKAAGTLPPAILITGRGDIGTAVAAMREGAMDFIEKPVSGLQIVDSVRRALARNEGRCTADAERAAALGRLAKLTARQRQVMAMVLEGHPSKNIAADLHLSLRTVENHRAEIMRRSGCRSLPELARLVMFADPGAVAPS
jgi:two-component system CheB/CheR fusion protein